MTTASHPLALTDAEKELFDEQGFLILRDRIPLHLLERCRTAAQTWIDAAECAPADHPRAVDWHRAERGGRSRLFRVDYVHDKGGETALELLGSPEILGIAESLAGPDFVPTYESLVFKGAGDGAPVPWHQDAVHPRRHRIFNVGVYLDDSRSGEGALRVLPGSQRRAADICAIEQDAGWEPNGYVEVELAAGDVLVHDTMLVHGSPAVRGNRLRRTIYLEFRPAQQIIEEGPWDRAWIDARMRLVPLALASHDAAPAGSHPFSWSPSPELRPSPAPGREAELRIAHSVHTPGSYCSAGPPTAG
ncbi:phytanoyl-CoA dioxygenase family protein [Streptomyces rubiginosohelvolus]|uniref:phytanoyl-CoA dioxygenase family protein n=1 Tax=Streptomyces rubiginosohelvolus TaxID=67362 RepID=UPI0036D926C9